MCQSEGLAFLLQYIKAQQPDDPEPAALEDGGAEEEGEGGDAEDRGDGEMEEEGEEEDA